MLPQRLELDEKAFDVRGLAGLADRILVPQPKAFLALLRNPVSRKLRQRLSHVIKRWRLVLISDRAGTVTSSAFLICGRFDHRHLCFSLTLI
jgi:hypothetical protein